MVHVILGGPAAVGHRLPAVAVVDALPPDHIFDPEWALVSQRAVGERVAGATIHHEVQGETEGVIGGSPAARDTDDRADAELAPQVVARGGDRRLDRAEARCVGWTSELGGLLLDLGRARRGSGRRGGPRRLRRWWPPLPPLPPLSPRWRCSRRRGEPRRPPPVVRRSPVSSTVRAGLWSGSCPARYRSIVDPRETYVRGNADTAHATHGETAARFTATSGSAIALNLSKQLSHPGAVMQAGVLCWGSSEIPTSTC